jgi:hypothetical protein
LISGRREEFQKIGASVALGRSTPTITANIFSDLSSDLSLDTSGGFVEP